MNRILVAAVIAAGILAGALAHQYFRQRDAAAAMLERATLYQEPRALPDFALVDQDGAAFGPARLRGRWTFLFFGFVNCPDICPTTLATLAAVRRTLADLPVGEQPGVALVSVDPARDSPPVLARYVSHFDPTFTGLTGAPGRLDALTQALGVAVFVGAEDADGNYAVDHSAAVFLVDPEARVVALFNTPHDAATIARDYRRILLAG